MGRAVADMARKCGNRVKAIIDRNPSIRGSSIDGVSVICPEDCSIEVKQSVRLIVAISAVPYHVIADNLRNQGFQRVDNSGDYLREIGYKNLVNVWTLDDSEGEQFNIDLKCFFEDEESVCNYDAAVGWFAHREENIDERILSNWDREKYFPSIIQSAIRPTDSMVDTAILSGEYVRRFFEIAKDGNALSFVLTPRTITPGEIESLRREFDNLRVIDVELGESEGTYKCVRTGIMKPFDTENEIKISKTSLDCLGEEVKCDFFRGYSMSPVLPILRGSINTIHRCRPILALNIGHYKDDFVKVPAYLKEMLEEYVFLFRMHSFQGNDCILYAIPYERRSKG